MSRAERPESPERSALPATFWQKGMVIVAVHSVVLPF